MSKTIDVAIKVAEQQQEREFSSQLQARLEKSARDSGNPGTMRNTILTYVATGRYDVAITELNEYYDMKNEYPSFRARGAKYLEHSIDLINAVKSKKSFPGVQTLSLSKQQELLDRATSHFDELKFTLKKIEHLDREVKLEDVRSTVFFIKVTAYCLFAILVFAFVREASKGVLPTISVLLDDMFGRTTNFIFDKLGL